MFHDGDFCPVMGRAYDLDVIGTDHEVVMGNGEVDAFFDQLFSCQSRSVLNAVREARAEGQVAGGILIDQTVVEDPAHLTDR